METFYLILFWSFVLFGLLPAFGATVMVASKHLLDAEEGSLYAKGFFMAIFIFMILLVAVAIYETIGHIHSGF